MTSGCNQCCRHFQIYGIKWPAPQICRGHVLIFEGHMTSCNLATGILNISIHNWKLMCKMWSIWMSISMHQVGAHLFLWNISSFSTSLVYRDVEATTPFHLHKSYTGKINLVLGHWDLVATGVCKADNKINFILR